ncbi:hypothetical protein AAFF_G00424760 [Aldrovandia affinis]|uniref:Uncharacterized protein n=1 Tax=Aldrovandia affinis TaxID=143900 RepID=A0AAD7WZI5_9TELE|nr:hypothetical protein AAFF_G00424760 [Aldrovandia affinis]
MRQLPGSEAGDAAKAPLFITGPAGTMGLAEWRLLCAAFPLVGALEPTLSPDHPEQQSAGVVNASIRAESVDLLTQGHRPHPSDRSLASDRRAHGAMFFPWPISNGGTPENVLFPPLWLLALERVCPRARVRGGLTACPAQERCGSVGMPRRPRPALLRNP